MPQAEGRQQRKAVRIHDRVVVCVLRKYEGSGHVVVSEYEKAHGAYRHAQRHECWRIEVEGEMP